LHGPGVAPQNFDFSNRRHAARQCRANTEISSEDRAVRAVAGFVCFISLFDGRSI
jgi:hypothetical protein